MKNKIILFIFLVLLILIVFGMGLLIGSEFMTEKNSQVADALDKIVKQNPEILMEHGEHFGIVLTNGDVIEFSKDISIGDADAVMLISAAGIDDGVINLDKVQPCPPPGQKLTSGKFCYIPNEVLAAAEPDMAEKYPKGIILRPFDI